MRINKDQSFGLRPILLCVLVEATVAMLRVLHWSWRKDVAHLTRLDTLVQSGEPLVVVFWHDSYLPLFALCQGRNAHVLIAPGFRGDVITGICRAFGYSPVFVGGAAGQSAHRLFQSALGGQTHAVAVAIDGPVGPRHKPKDTILRLARDMGFAIVPTSVTAWPRLILRHRWDRMQVPLPFARISLCVADPIRISGHANELELQSAQEALITALETDCTDSALAVAQDL